MKNLKLILVVVLLLSISKSMAQSTNSQKIIGCWSLKNMEFTQKVENPTELINNALNTLICFNTEGKFTTTKAGETSVVTGKFKVSEDGKTLHQTRDVQDEGNDEDGQIVLIDEKQLIFKTDYVTLIFDRKL
jgi:hypothetical protein